MRHEAGHDMIDKGEINPKSVRDRIAAMPNGGNIDELSRRYAEAYAGSNMTPEEIWDEIICDSLGDMNIFSDSETETKTSKSIETVKRSAEQETPGARGPPSTGKSSREWQSYELTEEFVREVKPEDRHAFLRQLANKTVGVTEDHPRYLMLAINDSVYFFKATGYMNGHPEKTAPSKNAKSVSRARKEYLRGIDNNTETVDSQIETVRSDGGRAGRSVYSSGQGDGSDRNAGLSGGESESDRTGYTTETTGDTEEEPVGSITYDGEGRSYKVEKDGTKTYFSREPDANNVGESTQDSLTETQEAMLPLREPPANILATRAVLLAFLLFFANQSIGKQIQPSIHQRFKNLETLANTRRIPVTIAVTGILTGPSGIIGFHKIRTTKMVFG